MYLCMNYMYNIMYTLFQNSMPEIQIEVTRQNKIAMSQMQLALVRGVN